MPGFASLLRRLHAALLAGAALTPLGAQTQIVHSAFDNLVFDNGVSMGGPNLWLAIKTQMPATAVATYLEVFTGERTGANSLSLWSHDPVGNRPLTQLGSGSFLMSNTNGWQGAALPTPVLLTAGQDLWLVWAPQNGAQSSVQGTGPGAQSYRGSFDGGQTWNGPFQSLQWKFRIWTGTPGSYQPYGTGCQGSRGVPQLYWFGRPFAGGSFDVLLARGPLGGAAILSFGASDTTAGGLPLPYSLAPLGAPGCNVLASAEATLLSGVDPVGAAVVPIALPANPAIVGVEFYNQWFCLDAAANALGLSASNAGEAVVGG